MDSIAGLTAKKEVMQRLLDLRDAAYEDALAQLYDDCNMDSMMRELYVSRKIKNLECCLLLITAEINNLSTLPI